MAMVDGDPEDVVLVPVPVSMLGVVYGALARSMRLSDIDLLADSTSDPDPVVVQGQGQWTRAMVERLEADLSYMATRTLITMAAERAPRSVTFAEAVKQSGVEEKKLRAELGGLSKITKRTFGVKSWPFAVKYGDMGEASYSMEPDVAQWWLHAENEETGSVVELDAVVGEISDSSALQERSSTVPRGIGTITCRVCGMTMPEDRFPTTTADRRGTECRPCRDKRRGYGTYAAAD